MSLSGVLFCLAHFFGPAGTCFYSPKADIAIGTGHDVAFLIAGRAAKPPERDRIDGVEQAV